MMRTNWGEPKRAPHKRVRVAPMVCIIIIIIIMVRRSSLITVQLETILQQALLFSQTGFAYICEGRMPR